MPRLTNLLLRSPLHRFRSGRWLLVDAGEGDVALRFVLDGESVVVLGGDEDDWWRGLSTAEPTPLKVTLAGQQRQGAASFLTGDELDEAMLAYLHAHPSEWTRLAVGPGASGDDVAAAAHESAVIMITLS